MVAAAAFDVVPTGEVWARADARLALLYWHWAFLAQPAPLPERLIGADPAAFFNHHVRTLGIGRANGRYPPALVTAYRGLLDDPGTVQAICEDCRAGATIDRMHDEADVLDVWRPGADTVTGRGVDASHFLVEDQPEQVADELHTLLGAAAAAPSTPSKGPS